MTGNPYVFVTGCPRSGTTLLQRLLNHHSALAVTNDTHFIPRALKGQAADASTPLTAELVERVVGYHRFHRLGVAEDVARSLAPGAETYAQYVGLLYDRVAEQAGKQHAGEKTPDYVRNLPLLHRLFPAVRSLQIIRDGRDVALSVLEWATPTKGPGRFPLWRDEPVAVSALWWRWQVGQGRDAAEALGPDRHLELRYERLVEDTETVMRSVCAFLDLPFDQAMLDFHVGKRRNDAGLSAKKAWLPPTPGLRDWRQQYREEDLALFEALAGDLLEELGYERAVPTVSPSTMLRAERCRRQWQIELAERNASRTSPA